MSGNDKKINNDQFWQEAVTMLYVIGCGLSENQLCRNSQIM